MKHNDDGEYLSLSMHGPDRKTILECADGIAGQYFGADLPGNLSRLCRYVDRVELVDTDFNGKVLGWTMEVRYKVIKDITPTADDDAAFWEFDPQLADKDIRGERNG